MSDANEKTPKEPDREPDKPRHGQPSPHAGEQPATGANGEGYRVLLFNDSVHTFEEVVGQLSKALHCGLEDASEIAGRAHENGAAVVVIASEREANRISKVLRQIGLHVKVDKVG
jgi:ATP-dependent Clp protease adaptor protein ClpS